MNCKHRPAYVSVLSLVLVLIMCMSLTACGNKEKDEESSETQPASVSYEYTIAVIESSSVEEREAVYEGFVSALAASGYKDGENILVIRSTPDEAKGLEDNAETAITNDVDIIFAIGEDAAKAAVKVTESIPVIFACVNDPIEAGLLTSCEMPDKNVTGVSDFVPVYSQLEFARKILPKTKNVSVLYCETDENSILISSLLQEESLDFAMTCNTFTATTERNLGNVLTKALDKTSLLYLPEDTLTTALFEKILKAANNKKIPVMTSGEELVSKGALLTVIPDYSEIGYVAGEMVLASLKGLKTVSDMPVMYPKNCIRLINRTAAKILGIDISGLEADETLVITKTQ